MKNKNISKFNKLINNNKSTLKFSREIYSIEELIKTRPDINLDPPYQRKFVWNTPNQELLIYQIFVNMTINPIHLAIESLENGGEKFTVMDGKQRLTSIFNFIDNKFKIGFDFNGENIEYSYRDLSDIENNKDHVHNPIVCKNMRNFRKYRLDVTEYKDLNINEQVAIFDVINNGEPLTADEKLLSENFHCKQLATFLMNGLFEKIHNKSKSKGNKRSTDYIWTLQMLHCLLDDDCKDIKINLRNFTNGKNNKNSFNSFVVKLQSKILKYWAENKNTVTSSSSNEEIEKMIISFGWLDYLKKLSKITEDFI